MKVYGIKNCNKVRDSLKHLDSHEVTYDFVDYKKNLPSQDQIKQWIGKRSFEEIINKNGLTWKRLPKEQRDAMTEEEIINFASQNSSIIKRPLIESNDNIILGLEEIQNEFK